MIEDRVATTKKSLCSEVTRELQIKHNMGENHENGCRV